MRNLGQFCEKKFLVKFNTNEILGDLIAILSARVPQGNFYVSKGIAKRPERIFHQMSV